MRGTKNTQKKPLLVDVTTEFWAQAADSLKRFSNLPQPNGEGTGPAMASDLLMLPMPQIMQPGVDKAENLAPQRSQTS